MERYVWVDIYKRTGNKFFRKWKWVNSARLEETFAAATLPDRTIATYETGTFKRVWRK